MVERMDLLARIAEKADVDEIVAEEVLANLVGELAATDRKEPGRPVVELPPYFDRYVTTEILHLKEQLGAFRAEVELRFTEVNRRFAEVGQRFTEMGDEMNRRFTEMGAEMDRRFTEMGAKMDRRFTEVDGRFDRVDRRFDRLERWFFVVGVPIILGILTIIVKMFFSVP